MMKSALLATMAPFLISNMLNEKSQKIAPKIFCKINYPPEMKIEKFIYSQSCFANKVFGTVIFY